MSKELDEQIKKAKASGEMETTKDIVGWLVNSSALYYSAATDTQKASGEALRKLEEKEAIGERLIDALIDKEVRKAAVKIQTLANEYDLPSITTWKQGHFIDNPRYNKMGVDWKERQTEREKTLIRPYGGTNNGLFQVSGTDRATDITAYLEKVGEVLAQLTKETEEDNG